MLALAPVALIDLIDSATELSEVASTVKDWYTVYYRSAAQAYPERFEHFDQSIAFLRGKKAQAPQGDKVQFMQESGLPILEAVEHLLTGLEVVFEEFDREGLNEQIHDLVFSIEEEREKLQLIRRTLEGLTPIHSRLQLHFLAHFSKYDLTTRWRSSQELERALAPKLKLYTSLVNARELFFDEPSANTLRGYLSVVDDLAKKDAEALLGQDYEQAKHWEELLESIAIMEAELIRDEMMFELTVEQTAKMTGSVQ